MRHKSAKAMKMAFLLFTINDGSNTRFPQEMSFVVGHQKNDWNEKNKPIRDFSASTESGV